MGKGLQNSNLVQRKENLAFYELPDGRMIRMEGFTNLGHSKNPKEYSRQYVDEDSERTDITGYSPAIAFAFDRYKGNAVLDDLVKISDNEYVGNKMVRRIISVDLTTAIGTGTQTAQAKIREYAVIPDSNGDSTDCMTYSGNFKARGVNTDCNVTSKDDWQTIDSLDYNTGTSSYDTIITAYLEDGSEITLEGGVGGNYTATVPSDSDITFKIEAEGSSYITVADNTGSTLASAQTGSSPFTTTAYSVSTLSEHKFVIIVADASKTSTYCVTITVE